ncbi:MAG: c-type cytochrome biogenesis protein CcmI [Alphaproteobacteria bacterium]|jgi:cytochrome c-type biogenesis protein CcmH|nr:c-type cytochrome biogenesis protein CcmI [Alphaproteobacteria bacterium]
MIFWVIVALMTAAVAASLLWPLYRGRAVPADAAEYDLAVYRDQLAELDREEARGALGEAEAEAARAEIGRRILAADARREAAAAGTADKSRKSRRGLVAGAIALGASLGTLLFYLAIGAPGLPGQPFAERAAERQAAQHSGAQMDMAKLVQQLRQRLEKSGGEVQGWTLLGRTYISLGRHKEAAAAYQRALGLEAGDASLHAAYGEALVFAAGGRVVPASRTAFEAALKLSPDDSRARFYMAEAARQDGDAKSALDQLVRMLKTAPADAPWIALVREKAGEAARSLGLDADTVLPAPPKPVATAEAPRTPSRADIDRAQGMAPKDRELMIRGMVAGLADRLRQNPKDFEGWMRLIRSYSVLGDHKEAKKALRKARKVFAKAPIPMQQFAALEAELDLDGDAPPKIAKPSSARPASAEPKGPTREAVAAAQSMSPEDRQTMIEGMVARLAARLEEQPDDFEGWVRLGRSYTVLRQHDKARDAMARAAKLAPKNVEVLMLYGRAIRSAAGEAPTPESIAVMRRVVALDGGIMEALWFVGRAEAEAGNTAAARDHWEKAYAALPETSPDRAELRRRIDSLPK